MTKYSLEDKIKAVHNVLELKMSPNAVARSLHTAKAVVQRWVARYERFGTDGLSMKSGKYSGDFKVRAVEYIHENSMSLFRATAHFGIPSEATVSKWERIYWEEGMHTYFLIL